MIAPLYPPFSLGLKSQQEVHPYCATPTEPLLYRTSHLLPGYRLAHNGPGRKLLPLASPPWVRPIAHLSADFTVVTKWDPPSQSLHSIVTKWAPILLSFSFILLSPIPEGGYCSRALNSSEGQTTFPSLPRGTGKGNG
ncbi:Hypothetical protein NTJ_09278 [Nesidiocoris tenuis]|uniref:Fibronectin type-III domain-containing protein n=1 Tax=Nesidiocoris tenuis TaxID=355587 RepID=A0ABN7AYL0_9HEMI|nr:Hypothetical protein NTJ_09278 [Nesidiocoris tenuis]